MSKTKDQPLILAKGLREISISITSEAIEQRDNLILDCADITVVKDKESQEAAVAAVRPLKALARQVEDLRKEIKAPILEISKKIDDTAKGFRKSIDEQIVRVEDLLSQYQAAEQHKIDEAIRLQRIEQERIAAEERKKQEAEQKAIRDAEARAAQAKNDEERKAAEAEKARLEEEKFQRELQQDFEEKPVAFIPQPVAKVEGTSVRRSFVFDVVDIEALYKTHPHLVKLEPRVADIKAFINIPGTNHATIGGIIVREEIKANVRK